MLKLLKQAKENRPLRQTSLSFGTASGIAAVSWYLNPAFLCGTGILFAHEIGHWATAKTFGADAQLPYFVPLGPIVIGVTKVKDLPKPLAPVVSLAGPVASINTAFMLMSLGLVLNSPLIIIVCIGACITELINGLFGRDGRIIRARKHNK